MSVLLGQAPCFWAKPLRHPDSGLEVIEHPELEIPGTVEES
jgi:hypothetical protein